LIAAVWVNPDADDERTVYANNEAATLAALAAGRDGAPTVAEVLDAGLPQNPFFSL
jgi:formaldehyde-activating enzyme involved in methanogenesis